MFSRSIYEIHLEKYDHSGGNGHTRCYAIRNTRIEKYQRLRSDFVFPVALFFVLWLLAFVFVILLKRTVRNFHATTLANPLVIVFGAVVLVLIAVVWGGIVSDQMPCFMGVPNCD